ncbi:MAG: heavy-metal-associated domain-containing protein [Candidatus Nitrotoga sp.]
MTTTAIRKKVHQYVDSIDANVLEVVYNMLKLIRFFAAASICVGLGMTHAFASSEKSVTLNLGGSFCEFYPNEITAALKKLPGVKSVDAQNKQKFVVVHFEDGKVTTDQMITALRGVKQEGMWHCDGSVK